MSRRVLQLAAALAVLALGAPARAPAREPRGLRPRLHLLDPPLRLHPRGLLERGGDIAYGTGSFATVRSIFSAWIHSTGHRANILSTGFRDLGVGYRVGTLDGARGAHVWVQHFGAHC